MSKPAFYTTRLSDGRKVELSEEEWFKHMRVAAADINILDFVNMTFSQKKKLVRSHLELVGHLEKGK